MPVSYPAIMPSTGITSVTWTNMTSSLVSRSPFTFQGQAQSYGGSIRQASITVEDLNRDSAEDWIGFLDALQGTLGTFLFGDPAATATLGSSTEATYTINSLGAGGDRFKLDVTPSASVRNGFFRRGDWIQLGSGLSSRLYKMNNNIAVPANTAFTNDIVVWPKFRNTPVVGDVATVINPRGLFRRSSASYSYSESNDCRYSISFDAEEVV